MTKDSHIIKERIKENREKILAVCAKYGARNVRIFGSVARGEARPESDIDILVEMDDGHGFFDLLRLEDEAENLLGRHIDVVTVGGISPYIREKVLSQAVAL